MKKVPFLFYTIFLLSSCIVFSQHTDSTKKLIQVESLISKVQPDTSRFIDPMDTLKVDTVYIENPLNVIKVGANMADAFGMGFIAYERVIAFMGSLQLKVEFLGTYNPFQNAPYIEEAYANTNSIAGLGLVPEGRYYGSEKYAPKGLFVGLYLPLRFASVSVPQTIDKNGLVYTLPSDKLTYSLLGVGVIGGYQFIIHKHLTVEGVIGFAIAKGTFSEAYYTNVNMANGMQTESKLALKDGTIGRAYYPRVEISVGYSFK